MDYEIRRVGSTRDQLGEGPLWDGETGALYWVDSVGRRIRRLDPETGALAEWLVPAEIGSMALRAGGGAVIALANGFHLFDFETGHAELIADPEADNPMTRFNDGKVDRQGRFIAGTMRRDGADTRGALYRLDYDHTIERIEDDIVVSNGPCFSPDGRTFYFADSPRRRISAYDYDTQTGKLANRRTLIDTNALESAPDGATVDAEGYIWSALVISAQIARFSPAGDLDRLIDMPVTFPSSVMFGGAGLDVLYVTSISVPVAGRTPDAALDGALLQIEGLGVHGLAEPRFAG